MVERKRLSKPLPFAASGPGRPTGFEPRFAKIAQALCSRGATDGDLAQAFEVHTSTIRYWMSHHPEFGEAVRYGKAVVFDPLVERALAQRAIGYEVDVTEYKVVDKTIEPVTFRKHYPPDTTACIFWLKNRNPKQWRDVHVVEQGKAELDKMTAAELLDEIMKDAKEIGIPLQGASGVAPLLINGKVKH